MKTYFKIISILLFVSVAVKAQTNDSFEAPAPSFSQALKQYSPLKAILSAAHLKSDDEDAIKVLGVEFNLRYGFGQSEDKGLSTDGPVIVLQKKLSDRVRAQVKLAFENLVVLDGGKITHPLEWQDFFEEAKIIIDADPKSKIPVITVIGKQDLHTTDVDSALAVDDNSPMTPLTLIEGANAIQFQLDVKSTKIFDQIIVAGLNTDNGSDLYQGDNIQKNANGAMVVVTKTIGNLVLTGGLSHINYEPKAESRVNFGVAYEIEDNFKVYLDAATFKNNPYYLTSKKAFSVGASKTFGKNEVVVEASVISHLKKQLAIGYNRTLSDKLELGFELRRDYCEQSLCQSGWTAMTQAQYHIGQDVDAPIDDSADQK